MEELLNIMGYCARYGIVFNVAGPMACQNDDGSLDKVIQFTCFKKKGEEMWDKSAYIYINKIHGMKPKKRNIYMFNAAQELVQELLNEMTNEVEEVAEDAGCDSPDESTD